MTATMYSLLMTTTLSACCIPGSTNSGRERWEHNSARRSPVFVTPPTTCFETFPFPEPSEAQYAAIAEAAARLNELRGGWLNPPNSTEAELKKRTLTNLYNQRPAWLNNAHNTLDAAVAAAYGWPADLSDAAILENLLALNLQRSE